MSDVLRRIADIHRARVAKAEEVRTAKTALRAREVELFRASGIPAMWEDVKDIQVRNFAPENVAGFTPRLADFVIGDDALNINGNGLALYNNRKPIIAWKVVVNSFDQAPAYCMSKGCFTHQDAAEKMVQDFVQWLAKRITPRMLLEMDIDLSPVEPQKQTRRIQKLEAVS
jgi:hypothetical protein